jgi:uncharacterized MAPEG superfamily protein
MTRNTSARIAGFTFLFYSVIGMCNELLTHRVMDATGEAAKLASISQHATDVRLTLLIVVFESFSALVLAVTLYGITRDHDMELATLAMVSRVAEGILGILSIPAYLGLLWLAESGPAASDMATTNALRAFLLMPGPSVPLSAIFFSLGSTVFSYLLLRGRIVPAAIGWLNVLSAGLLLVLLPIQLAGFSTGSVSGFYQWVPALVSQTVLALWLLTKGVAP